MSRFAVFVDAGYLFAQGAKAISGANQPRTNLLLNEEAAIAELMAVAEACAPTRELLRIYWYDGTNNFKGPTLDHERLARTNNVKLRLGFINAYGQQKGVDSLIVTDMIDLARNHAITDAILLSGDEDIRIGVQIAQQFGVRVHLVGIEPSVRSQSKTLCQEADTTTEWTAATVAKYLALTSPIASTSVVAGHSKAGAALDAESAAESLTGDVQKCIAEFASAVDPAQSEQLVTHWTKSNGVPPEYDGRLLARCRTVIGRDLTATERRLVRAEFRKAVEFARQQP